MTNGQRTQEGEVVVSKHKVFMYELPGEKGRDPVKYLFDDGPGYTHMFIHCGGKTWNHYFGAIGGRRGIDFFTECGTDYIVMKMLDHSAPKSKLKMESEYLARVVDAIKEGIKSAPEVHSE